MKKLLILLASLALVASGLSIGPAAAAEPGATGGVVPDAPNIVDDAADANAGALPVTFTGMDVLAGWLTHDATNVYMHIQTTSNARAEAATFQTNVGTAPGLDCVQLRMTTGGEASDSFSAINSTGDCGEVATTRFGPLLEEDGPEGTSILTGTFPREGLPMLVDGAVLTEPNILVGFYGQSNPVAGGSRIGTIDDTEVGTDYTVASETPSGKTPPGKNDPPGKKKGCDKGKGKKRGCEGKGKKAPKTGKPAKSCTPVVPSTSGAEAPHVTLTDAHTAEAPLVQPVELEQRFDEGLTGATPSSVNVTVDTADKEIGLYATLEFPTRRDYDLWAYFPGTEDEEAASSHGFNPLAETQGINDSPDPSNTASNHGGETTASSENLVGILTPDCGGYTISAYNYFGEGGELELKLWLGEVSYDPAETGGGRAVASIYDSMLSFI